MRKKTNEATAVEIRQETQKEVVIEELRKRPIIQSACQKVGVGRATFYRWKKEDPVFAEVADEAIATGAGLVNDMAESQLLVGIRNSNMTAIIFWLKHHHKDYTTRVELLSADDTIDVEISDEQEKLIRKSVAMLRKQPKRNAQKKLKPKTPNTDEEDASTTK